MTGRTKILLLFVIVVIPAVLSAVTAKVAFTRAERVEFCASCHTMTPWIEDVTGKDGDSLAHDHFARRWIQHDQCYTCHSNYGFFGPIEAKIKGVRHVVAFYTGHVGKIELYDKFPNENCLQCHAKAKGFLEESQHEPVEDLISGKDSCLDCHENLHGVEQEEAAAAGEAKADEADDSKADDTKAGSDKGDSGKGDKEGE